MQCSAPGMTLVNVTLQLSGARAGEAGSNAVAFVTGQQGVIGGMHPSRGPVNGRARARVCVCVRVCVHASQVHTNDFASMRQLDSDEQALTVSLSLSPARPRSRSDGVNSRSDMQGLGKSRCMPPSSVG